jgi:serine/threonine protein kinase
LAGRYRLLSRIGSGGMGAVWRAYDDRLGREVAIKTVFLPPGLTTAEREQLYARTLREARSSARLSHPGIVTVHDVFEENGRPCIVMELLHARSLDEVIRDDGRMSPVRAAEIGAGMLAALRAAHAAGVLHRDVKPANVLLVPEHAGEQGEPTTAARVVITDFGIAAIEGEEALTHTGMVMGSPSFIAPERVRGEWASPASDLWSLGATLYTATEGRPPYVRGNAMQTLMAVRNDDWAPPRHAGPLTPVLMGLLAKDVTQRMSAEQAAEGLAEVVRQGKPLPSSNPGTAVRDMPEVPASPYAGQPNAPEDPHSTPEAAQPSGEPPRTRRWKTPVFAGLAVLVVAVAAGLLLLRPTGGKAGDATVQPSAVLSGSQRARGPGTATLAVPDGWHRKALNSASVGWSEPATRAYIQVNATPWGVSDPADYWRKFRRDAVRRSAFPAMHVLRLGRTFSAKGWATADMEFTSGAVPRRKLRGYGRAFTASGHQYTILVVAPAARWSKRYTTVLTTAFNAFQPASS